MIIMSNEMNQMCQDLNRKKYFYEPHITTEVLPDGKWVPKVCCKAFPEKGKDFYNILSFDELEDKVDLVKEKWENFMYDEEKGEESPEL